MRPRPRPGPLRRWWRDLTGSADGVRVEPLPGPGARGLADRTVQLWLPPGFRRGRPAPLLLMLDGQTAPQWRLGPALAALAAGDRVAPVVAAVPASADRLEEHGTAGILDFAGRGRLARLFQDYLVYEVLPAARERCGLRADRARTGIFGASMGGLCAFDTAWRHPQHLGLAGVFSGSLWWRTDDRGPAAQQASRIAHRRVRETPGRPDLRLWFQAGTRDETADRDGDGVIDAIQDTRELLAALAEKGLSAGRELAYHEVAGGEHHEATWAAALPEFLRWALPARR